MFFKSPEAKARALVEKAIACGPPAMIQFMKRWQHYTTALKFKAEVPLEEIIYSFTIPLMEFTRREYPVLLKAPPEIFFRYLFAGIEAANTHSKAELDQAKQRFAEKYSAPVID